jgi:CRISPR/Cas system endoribonuclease Cas6 (RAMP superfamily)
MILSRKNKGCHYPSGKVSLININTYFQLYSRLFPDGQQPNYLNFIFLISSGYVKFVRDISSNIKRYRRITFSRFECVKNIYGRTIFKQYWSDVCYVTGSPIPICFLLMCLSTLQCRIGDNSM